MDYIIRFSQSHESFRVPEVQALATLENIDLKVLSYSPDSPFCIIRISPSTQSDAIRLVKRAILVQTISELWGTGVTTADLHASVRATSSQAWPLYRTTSFKFWLDSYQGARTNAKRLSLIKEFAYLPFEGEVRMSNPEEEFTIFEDWPDQAVPLGIPDPKCYHLGRRVGYGARDLPQKLDLKKRTYISTTSMDSELALITANMCLAAPGKMIYDPFVGTGSFPIACGLFGALTFGSDIDGRSVRGDEKEKTLKANFEQYGLRERMGAFFTADLTNSPIRRAQLGTGGGKDGRGRTFDAILCDPPYGVREGLVVLGVRDPEGKDAWRVRLGKTMERDPTYLPPKKPYSFNAMLDDIMQFSAQTLVDYGRLSFWMPTANDEDQEIAIPTHPYMELVVVCTQPFNKWSRRLITYQRLPDEMVDSNAMKERIERTRDVGTTADELNPFRRGYFTKFGKES
ncbi:S-adenosyl-L-methionine-dependent methyltransferase [Coniochaeta sp. 2T2.1]|nr:S-adenosyl-L-methionine-dependent methyltransferase [Coniochaeta sp. 2T2.1]